MNIDDVKNIAVIGAGNMGHQISLLSAIRGYKVVCTDVSDDILKKAEKFAEHPSPRPRGKTEIDGRRGQGRPPEDFLYKQHGKAVKDADYVIEAVIEVLDVKRKLFAALDKITPKHAILATNHHLRSAPSSQTPTSRPSKVVNLHFFNPALVMKLVEVVKGPHVSDETADISFKLCERLDKVPVIIKKEVEGFLLNRIFKVISQEALWMLDMGVATAEDIDKACVFGAGHPMGPFRLMDLTGIDLSYTISMGKFRQTGDPADRPSPSVVDKFIKGHYGEKTKMGWYDYTKK